MHFEQELLAKGIRADISLEDEHLDNPKGVDFFLWLPTKDHTPPKVEQLTVGVQTLEQFVKSGIPCYVHCKNGHGRGPTLVAAFLIRTQGFTADEAIAFIKARRPAIHLEESQREMLVAFESANPFA